MKSLSRRTQKTDSTEATMFELKPITRDGVSTALHKAERYRLLNEPTAAESICRDVLECDPDNQQALIMLVLALSDQFALGGEMSAAVHAARDVLGKVRDEYKRAYYNGIICERRAKAQMRRGAPGAEEIAYDWFREAMEWYEKAERLRPAGNDEAILRWNTCARLLNRDEHLRPAAEPTYEPSFE
ncbi:MAG TPA: hypothetical protein VK922_17715 [Gemmatimonadaceae bacterium]|nr:hypothetical protein [Gemmatimonadaceae bacterium]